MGYSLVLSLLELKQFEALHSMFVRLHVEHGVQEASRGLKCEADMLGRVQWVGPRW